MRDIINDHQFWMRTKWLVNGWLGTSPEKEHRRYAIDDLEPVSIRCSKWGAVVRGTASVFDKTDLNFVALLPLMIANHPSVEFEVGSIEVDPDREMLEIELREIRKEPNKAPEPTPRPVTIPAEPGIAPGRVVAHL